MIATCGRMGAVLVVVGLGAGAAAQPMDRVSPPPIFPRLAGALAQPHRPTPVPPGLEIEVLDPNVDPRGNPAVVLQGLPPGPGVGPEGRTVVDIPPTVLVHRYYYTGNRSFQAQLLTGGPCILVANHPRRGERMYVPVSLPPGAPRVRYTDSTIEYDYGTQAVTVDFCCLLHDRPKVTYRQGVPTTQKVAHVAMEARDSTRRLVQRTGLPELADRVASGTKNVVVTTVDRVSDLSDRVTAPARQVIRSSPLGTLFTSTAEDRAARERDAMTKRVKEQEARGEAFLRTLR